MKKEIHPQNYRQVIFSDNSSGVKFLIPSTLETKETAKFTDGKDYPVHFVEISSASHPFYTNQEKLVDTAGRVEKFKTRMTKKAPAKPIPQDRATPKKVAEVAPEVPVVSNASEVK